MGGAYFMETNFGKSLWAGAVVVFFSLIQALAQSAPPSIQGKILDASGAPVPRARISVAARGESGPAVVESNESGGFSIILPAGSYTLQVSADGFEEVSRLVTASEAAEPVEI